MEVLATARILGGLPERLRLLGGALLEFLRGHVELLQVELAQERNRIGVVLWHGLVLGLVAFLTVQCALLFVVVMFWDTAWRLHAIGALTVAALLATIACVRRWQHVRAPREPPFDATVAELRKDRELIEGIRNGREPEPRRD